MNIIQFWRFHWTWFWAKILSSSQPDEENVEEVLRELLLTISKDKVPVDGEESRPKTSPAEDPIAWVHFKQSLEAHDQNHQRCLDLCQILYNNLHDEVISTTGSKEFDLWLVSHFKKHSGALPSIAMVQIARDNWQPHFHHATA